MRLRMALSGLLVLLGCLAAMAAVLVRWADAQLHSETYANTVGSLLQQPEVQTLITDAVSEAMESSGQDVPPGVQATIEQQVGAFVDTPLANELWTAATVTARDTVLQGSGSAVVVDVDDLVAELRQELSERGIDTPEPPPTETSVTVANSPAIAQVREAADTARTLAPILPLVAGGLLLLALLISPRRGATLAAAGFGVAIGMLILVVTLPLVEQTAVARISDERARLIATPIYETFAASLRQDLLWVMFPALVVGVIGLVLALATARRRSDAAGPAQPARYAGYH